jgi:hypothetical protein
MHLTRYHGVFAPHSKLRAAVTPAGRGKGRKPQADEGTEPSSAPRQVAMSWAQRLRRVFGVEIQACARCGGKLKVIASIEEPAVIAKILAHLERTVPDQCQSELPHGARAPPCAVPSALNSKGGDVMPLLAEAAGFDRCAPGFCSRAGKGGFRGTGWCIGGCMAARRGTKARRRRIRPHHKARSAK